MTRLAFRVGLLCALAVSWAGALVWSQGTPPDGLPRGGALDGVRPRVLVSTDIGGTDPDDFQSLVHLLLYADVIDLEGIVSSPFGPGRLAHILEVIDRYERDYPNLRTWSSQYPAPDALRALSRQGETEVAPYDGVRRSTDGADWIVRCARATDPRPLHVLVWGGLEDLAQALHDAPDILPKLRVFFVGGPNKKWSVNAYRYIASAHPQLWMIESNATYRGWFTGGNQAGAWNNRTFVQTHAAGHGALGDFFATRLDGVIKMGDTPSLGRLLRGAPDDPAQPSWGGRYVRAWDRSPVVFDRLTTNDDRLEQFGVMELALPLASGSSSRAEAQMVIENQRLDGHVDRDGSLRFRFSPRDAKRYDFTIEGDVPGRVARTGAITAVAAPAARAAAPSPRHPQWWTDDPSPDVAEGEHPGAKSVSRWREAFLADFADRLDRAARPAPRDCFIVAAPGVEPIVSDAAECGRETAPASTFKIPHALIALQTGAITGETVIDLTETPQRFDAWRGRHTLESAIKWSVLPFFDRTAALIGPERMTASLHAIGYGSRPFNASVPQFWITGEMTLSPMEQFVFLRRFFDGALPIAPAHLALVRRALTMPPGRLTNASGEHPFELVWPPRAVVRAKTGNTRVGDERVSWLVGAIELDARQYVFVARRRSTVDLESTAGAEVARHGLNELTARLGVR